MNENDQSVNPDSSSHNNTEAQQGAEHYSAQSQSPAQPKGENPTQLQWQSPTQPTSSAQSQWQPPARPTSSAQSQWQSPAQPPANPLTSRPANPERPAQPGANSPTSQAYTGPTRSQAANPTPSQASDPTGAQYPATGTYGQGYSVSTGTRPPAAAYAPPVTAQNPPNNSYLPPSAPPRRPRRGPGWGGLLMVSILVSALTVFATVAGLWGVNLIGNSPRLIEAESGGTTPVAPVVESQAATADWKAVNEAVGKSVVLIQAVSANGEGGTGSGVIIDDKRHILTNYHVVAHAMANEGGRLSVTLSDSRIYQAELVGADMLTDLAVIKLTEPVKDLTVARLGNSENLFVGQQVAAIGAPLGLKSTMTTGIISALDRPTVVSDSKIFSESGGAVFTNAIQVDASINPGNSGGPLFDAQGRVIGINSSIMSIHSTGQQQAGSIGLGFAIPIDLAKKVSSEIIKTGKVEHALIGIQVRPGYGKVGNAKLTGAVVTEVTPSSKFKQAGLREGDVILSVDGKSVIDSSSLIGYIRRYSPEDSVTLQVARNGKRLEIRGQLMKDNSLK